MKTRLLPLLVLLAFAGCDSSKVSNTADATSTAGDSQGPISAIATVGMVGDIVQNVGAQHVAVTHIMEW